MIQVPSPKRTWRVCAGIALSLAGTAAVVWVVGHTVGSGNVLRGHGDAFQHIATYLALSALAAALACIGQGRAAGAPVLWGVIVACLCGVVQELRQLEPNASLEWNDIGNDFIGAALGAACVWLSIALARRLLGSRRTTAGS